MYRPLSLHVFSRAEQEGSTSMDGRPGFLGPNWNAGVPTTPIARSRRDLQNVLLDLGLKPRKKWTSYRQNRAKPLRNSAPRIRAPFALGLARGGSRDCADCSVRAPLGTVFYLISDRVRVSSSLGIKVRSRFF